MQDSALCFLHGLDSLRWEPFKAPFWPCMLPGQRISPPLLRYAHTLKTPKHLLSVSGLEIIFSGQADRPNYSFSMRKGMRLHLVNIALACGPSKAS